MRHRFLDHWWRFRRCLDLDHGRFNDFRRRRFSASGRLQFLHQPCRNGLPDSRRNRGLGNGRSFVGFGKRRRGGNFRFRLMLKLFRLGFRSLGLGRRRHCSLHDFDRALDRRLFLRKVLIPNLLGELFRDRV